MRRFSCLTRPSVNRYAHRMFAMARYCMVLLLAISMAGSTARCGCSNAAMHAESPGDTCCSHCTGSTGSASCSCCQHRQSQPMQSKSGCHTNGHGSRGYCLHQAHRVKTDAVSTTVLPGPFAALTHLIAAQYLYKLAPPKLGVACSLLVGLARGDCSLLRQHCALVI